MHRATALKGSRGVGTQMRRRPVSKFDWVMYVSLALFVMLGGSFARSQLLGLSRSDGLLGAVAGISFLAVMVVVI